MLIDINLLPKKEKRNPMFIPVVAGIIAIAVFAGAFIYYELHSVQNQKTFTEQKLHNAQQLKVMYEAQLAEVQNTGTGVAYQLEKMVKWMETVPVSSVQVMEHVTTLLPSEGYISSISYGDSGAISLATQFSTLDQTTAYLYHLDQSSWIESVTLQNVSAVEQEESIEYYTANFSIQFDVTAMKADIKEEE